jgi:hypothetical protein
MRTVEFTGDQILVLLHELATRLAARGVHGDIKLVGGAALALQGIGNRPTADIDASNAEKTIVNSIAAGMATDYDLAPNWFNYTVAAFIPNNATWITLEELDGFTIQADVTKTPPTSPGSCANSTSPTPSTPSISNSANTANTPSP